MSPNEKKRQITCTVTKIPLVDNICIVFSIIVNFMWKPNQDVKRSQKLKVVSREVLHFARAVRNELDELLRATSTCISVQIFDIYCQHQQTVHPRSDAYALFVFCTTENVV